MIINTLKEVYNVLPWLSLIIPGKTGEKFSTIFKPGKDTFKNLIEKLEKPFDIEEIKKRTSNLRNLTFGVTHNCNLRCRYCGYGGNYQYNRSHSKVSMKTATFKKAFDWFFDQVNSPYRTTREDLIFSFYGGEPLLRFDEIMNACEYADELNRKNPVHPKIRLMITTNGVLLNQERAQKLLDKNFLIDISLDGPKDQHDLMRVKTDKTGTFNDVYANVKQLKKNFPEKYHSNIRFLLTVHPFHDIKKIEQFFLNNHRLFHENNVILSLVGFKYLVTNVEREWLKSRPKQSKQIEESLDKTKWFYKKMICSWLERIYSSPTQLLAMQDKFTGTCFPTTHKLFIDVDGSFHLCEKMNSHFPIGNVDTGLDYKMIQEILNNWNREILKRRCWECDMWWICNFCFATQATRDSMGISEDECRLSAKATQQSFFEFLNLMEVEDEKNHSDRFSDIDRYLELLQ
ncbi:MAG: radical SAM protein [Candidatus Omnitrophota bacterium]